MSVLLSALEPLQEGYRHFGLWGFSFNLDRTSHSLAQPYAFPLGANAGSGYF